MQHSPKSIELTTNSNIKNFTVHELIVSKSSKTKAQLDIIFSWKKSDNLKSNNATEISYGMYFQIYRHAGLNICLQKGVLFQSKR